MSLTRHHLRAWRLRHRGRPRAPLAVLPARHRRARAAPPASQRGLVLLMALVMLAFVTTLVLLMAARSEALARDTAGMLLGARVREAALAAEARALGVLAGEDRAGVAGTPDAPALQVLADSKFPGGSAGARIEDLQARLDLNSLLDGRGAADPLQVARFRRLLGALGLAPALANAVLDWMDADDLARRPGGAEDAWYGAATPSRRTADRPFVHPVELRRVRGFDDANYALLAPFVWALPWRGGLNVNDAPPALLASLADGMDARRVQALISYRRREPFRSVREFLASPPLAGLRLSPAGLAVSSEFFLVSSHARLDAASAHLQALVVRDALGVPHVVQRLATNAAGR